METKYKLCVFGDSGVGKTTFCRRYVTNVFEESSKSTIGVDLATKYLEIEGKSVGLQIWDFAGENRFHVLFPSFAQDSKGGIYMFDITNESSLDAIDGWLSFFKEKGKDGFSIPLLMVGAKFDLQEQRQVDAEDATDLAQKHGMLGYFECSSKTGENVETIFAEITKLMMKKAGLI